MNQIETEAPATGSLADAAKPKKFQPFGPKAHNFAFRWPKDDATINILSGSVRSAKTWSTLVKILLLCRYEVAGRKVLTGFSKDTIYRNVLNDLFEIIHQRDYTYNRQSGDLTIYGTKWLVIGAHDEGSERVIRGMTVGAAVCDELVKMPEGFFKMLLSRMSPTGARLYATTNPDSPFHWVKVDVLDNKDYRMGLGADLWQSTFTMDDNPSLTEAYKDFLRRSYTGMWYQRFVLGNWVVAEGAVYRDVFTDDLLYDDDTRPIGLLHPNGHVDRFCALDMGTINAFAALDIYDQGNTLYIERELYFDSRTEGFQKTNSQYAQSLDEWFAQAEDRDRPSVIIDPSAASFKVELNQRGYSVIDADNEVLEGIRKVSTLLGNKRLRVHRRCVNLIREMQSYAWDEKRSEKGVEQPIKSHDHACFAAGTLIQTANGEMPIESLRAGAAIITPLGRCKVLAVAERNAETVAWNGTRVTSDHPVLTDIGLMPVDALRYNDRICEWNPSFSMALSFDAILIRNVCRIVNTMCRTASTSWLACGGFIKRYGNRSMDLFQKATTSITKMTTGAITTSLIWSCCPEPNICRCTESVQIGSQWPVRTSRSPELRLHDGTDLWRGASGTPKWRRRPPSTESYTITSVRTADLHSSRRALPARIMHSVLTTASRLPGANQVWTMFPRLARYAAWSSLPTGTIKPAPVVGSAARNFEKVYALRTEHGCYFANGVLVSNCDALRYGVATKWSDWRIAA
jgi:PBSX family phage terminase large subunit